MIITSELRIPSRKHLSTSCLQLDCLQQSRWHLIELVVIGSQVVTRISKLIRRTVLSSKTEGTKRTTIKAASAPPPLHHIQFFFHVIVLWENEVLKSKIPLSRARLDLLLGSPWSPSLVLDRTGRCRVDTEDKACTLQICSADRLISVPPTGSEIFGFGFQFTVAERFLCWRPCRHASRRDLSLFKYISGIIWMGVIWGLSWAGGH